jgi:hypothetical protein
MTGQYLVPGNEDGDEVALFRSFGGKVTAIYEHEKFDERWFQYASSKHGPTEHDGEWITLRQAMDRGLKNGTVSPEKLDN